MTSAVLQSPERDSLKTPLKPITTIHISQMTLVNTLLPPSPMTSKSTKENILSIVFFGLSKYPGMALPTGYPDAPGAASMMLSTGYSSLLCRYLKGITGSTLYIYIYIGEEGIRKGSDAAGGRRERTALQLDWRPAEQPSNEAKAVYEVLSSFICMNSRD